MLYAVASTGALKRGTTRPYGARTDAEWEYQLAERLEDEAADMATWARREAAQETGKARTDYLREAKTLSNIANKAHRAKTRLAPRINLGRPRRLGSTHEAYGFDLEITRRSDRNYCYTLSAFGSELTEKCGFTSKKAALTAGRKIAKREMEG